MIQQGNIEIKMCYFRDSDLHILIITCMKFALLAVSMYLFNLINILQHCVQLRNVYQITHLVKERYGPQ